jgi:hypothetical protein
MQDLGTMLSYLLIPANDCENRANKQQQHNPRRHKRLLRPLLSLEAALDWDQDTLARQILDHVQQWSASSAISRASIQQHDAGGAIVVLQHVHQLAPAVFAWLIRELSTPPTPHGSSSSSSFSHSSSYSSLYMHCQNIIFLFTSDTIGKASIVRGIRQAATSSQTAVVNKKPRPLILVNDDDDETAHGTNNSNNSPLTGRLRRPMDLVQDISRPSLTLDIQHELQLYLGGASSLASSMYAIVPFLPYAPLDLAEIVTLGMQQFWQETCHYGRRHQQQHQQPRWSRLVTTRAVVQALVHERNVEYIVWKTVINNNHGISSKSQKGGTKTTTAGGRRQLPEVLLTFSSTGVDPVQRYLLSLQVHLERCLQKAKLDANDKDDNHNAQEQHQGVFQSTKILVLDLSDDDTGKRGILNECEPQQHNDDAIIDNSLTPPPSSACTEICSFPLVS